MIHVHGKKYKVNEMYLKGIVNSFNCVLREEPSELSNYIISLNFGYQTLVEEDLGEWCKVCLASGIEGYLKKSDLGVFKIWEPRDMRYEIGDTNGREYINFDKKVARYYKR